MIEMVNTPIARSFLTDRDGGGVWCNQLEEPRPLPLILPLYVTPLAPEQEQQRIIIVSTPTWVRETIHDLHARRFANVKDWSSLLPGANPGEMVSILTRRRQRR